MMCVVQKEFTGAGEDFVRRQLVDGSRFRNEAVLISQRFLRPATSEEIASARFEDELHVPAPTRPKKSLGLKAKVKRH